MTEHPTAPFHIPARHRDDVEFEYIGRTALTVRGAATGIVYRFKRTGSRVFVRAKDSAALAAVAQLRRLSRQPLQEIRLPRPAIAPAPPIKPTASTSVDHQKPVHSSRTLPAQS
jgi:hypothetical protein